MLKSLTTVIILLTDYAHKGERTSTSRRHKRQAGAILGQPLGQSAEHYFQEVTVFMLSIYKGRHIGRAIGQSENVGVAWGTRHFSHFGPVVSVNG